MQNTAICNALKEFNTKYNKDRYDLSLKEATAFATAAREGDLYGAIADSFGYGFIKGIRYAKAMQKQSLTNS